LTFYDPAKTVVCDTECHPNFASIGFIRLSDRKTVVYEHSERKPLTEQERAHITSIMRCHTVVGYNFQNYDAPMIAMWISGASNASLKQANDRIILGGMKYWHAREVLGVEVPRNWQIIDLIEPQPNAFASLKTLMGRMHSKKLQDLPYSPDACLTPDEMDKTLAYMGNDLAGTMELFYALEPALELRAALGAEYGLNFMSKSDSQLGEAIVKSRVEKATGERVEKVQTPAGTMFKYKVPANMRFETAELRDVLERLRTTDFIVQPNGKVDLPYWLTDKQITLGGSTYRMGIGGLHSTESNRAVHSDDDNQLVDQDGTSFYPTMIINSGLYPKSCGPSYLPVAQKMLDDRVIAKRSGDTVTNEGLKIALNGALFGKSGSPYSVLYAPHLLVTVTLTGQLLLLMLIERSELAGIPVVSANTDGVVFNCPRDKLDILDAISRQWEKDTGINLEATYYQSLYSLSVNTYIAITEDGKVKRKGTLANPYKEGTRTQLMKNPNAGVCSDAVVELITKGTDIEDYIRAQTDIRDFVTVVNVKGGGTWRGDYLGKVVRYYWAKDGEEILYKTPHETTGNYKKVSKTDGCRPLMDLPDELPADIDYDRYVAEAREILMDIGFDKRPELVKPVRIFKWSAPAYFAIAV